MHRLCIDSAQRAFVSAIVFFILGLLALAACDSIKPMVVATPTRAVITQVVVATPVESRVSTPSRTPSAPSAILTSTGKVTQVETIANTDHVRVRLAPDDPAMRSQFMITDWNNITVLFYWVGLQTPTPVSANEKQMIVQDSLGRKVSIGYRVIDSAAIPQDPIVVLFSSHKQPGDKQ